MPKPRAPFRPAHAALLFLLAAAVAAVLLPGRRVREEAPDVLRALRAARGPVLPGAGRVGAVSATPARRYGRATLADVIDGAAEGYLANGFTAAAMAEYTFAAGAAQLEVSAEVHRFEREAGSAAQAEAERPRRAAPVPGLEGTVTDGAVLLAVSGRELLKLTVVSPGAGGAGGPAALVAIAAAWREERGP